MGVSKNSGSLFRGSHIQDHNILGSTLGLDSPIYYAISTTRIPAVFVYEVTQDFYHLAVFMGSSVFLTPKNLLLSGVGAGYCRVLSRLQYSAPMFLKLCHLYFKHTSK